MPCSFFSRVFHAVRVLCTFAPAFFLAELGSAYATLTFVLCFERKQAVRLECCEGNSCAWQFTASQRAHWFHVGRRSLCESRSRKADDRGKDQYSPQPREASQSYSSAVSHRANASKAQDHHGPGGGLGDGRIYR